MTGVTDPAVPELSLRHAALLALEAAAAATDHAAAFTPGGTYVRRRDALLLLPRRQRVLLAADWAESVLPVWERAYPDDDRPRRAIEAARAAAYYAAEAAAAAAAAAAADWAAVVAYTAYTAAADWGEVRRLWESAHNDGRVWRPEWRTPLAVELASDPEAYPVLLDHLEEQGADVTALRGPGRSLSNWAVYHALCGP